MRIRRKGRVIASILIVIICVSGILKMISGWIENEEVKQAVTDNLTISSVQDIKVIFENIFSTEVGQEVQSAFMVFPDLISISFMNKADEEIKEYEELEMEKFDGENEY